MEKIKEFMSKAEHYRDLARTVSDARARVALLELADEYEAAARALAEDRSAED